jgi:hypothetical protein
MDPHLPHLLEARHHFLSKLNEMLEFLKTFDTKPVPPGF